MAEHENDRQASDSEQSKDAGTAQGRAGGKPSFADTTIAADQQEQTATRRGEPRTTDETGETTTAAVPPAEPKDAMGDLTKQ